MRRSWSCPCPSLKPRRAPQMTCGACDMFSMPPTRQVLASPARMRWEPEMTDWTPEPQSRLTVSAGTVCGTPALSATWRAP
jgi:hypothetical protein